MTIRIPLTLMNLCWKSNNNKSTISDCRQKRQEKRGNVKMRKKSKWLNWNWTRKLEWLMTTFMFSAALFSYYSWECENKSNSFKNVDFVVVCVKDVNVTLIACETAIIVAPSKRNEIWTYWFCFFSGLLL